MKNTKDHIMYVALRLFLTNSFKGVTMHEIVKQAGVSKGAFYHYFESKEKLFWEILMFYFHDAMSFDFEKFSKESLDQFGLDYLAEVNKRHNVVSEDSIYSLVDINYYYVIFEGMKLFPEFREKLYKIQKNELAAWITIVGVAKKNGEIKSAMTDEQIAKLFVFISDGVGMRLIMGNKIDTMAEEISALWDGLYNQLKA